MALTATSTLPTPGITRSANPLAGPARHGNTAAALPFPLGGNYVRTEDSGLATPSGGNYTGGRRAAAPGRYVSGSNAPGRAPGSYTDTDL